ncbi:MAG: 8-oxo-dGTP diphosphatase [Candidatus Njordarchaeales archaeon]
MSVETLLYIIRDNKVLLILKKRGLGKGLYNGVGGKVEKGESIEEAVIRECLEEINVKPEKLEWRGLLEFHNDNELYGFVHVFVTEHFKGEPKETEEAKPIWFNIDDIPYDKMWEDDKYWLPHVLSGKKIYGRFWFINNWEKMIRKEVYILKEKRTD